MKKISNQSGVLHLPPLLIIIAFFGVITFLLITATAPFKGTFDGLFPKPASQAAEVIPPNCPDKLQNRINAAVAGSTITLSQNCVYREEVTINKSVILDGGNVAQIRGSDIWTGWNQTGTTWTSQQTVPLINNNYNNPDGRCNGKPLCFYPHQVFIDGVKQKLVLGVTPGSGQFSVDRNFATGPLSPAHIILGTSPVGHTVEVTTRYAWIYGNLQPADNVTVKNFTFRHAGTNAGKGALDIHRCNLCATTPGVITIQGNDIGYSHGENVAAYGNTKVLNNDIHHADNFGVGTGDNINDNKTNVLVQNNKIHDNNLDDVYNCGWGCGGEKHGGLINGVIDGNEVYNNRGPGIWCDVQCKNITISNNRVHDNIFGAGIFFEVSDGAKIFNNVVWKNSWADNGWGYDSGILVSSSRNAEVYNNIAAWNDNDQITVISQTRADHPAYSNAALNHYIHDNFIFGMDSTVTPSSAAKAPGAGLGWMAETSAMFDPVNNNRGANNKYYYQNPESTSLINGRFYWGGGGGHKLLANFNATAGEENGRYLTTIEKDQILAQNRLPGCPTCGVPSPLPSATPSVIPGDLDGDRDVDIFDYNILVENFGKTGTGIPGDLDKDGDVDIFDYNIIVENFGRTA